MKKFKVVCQVTVELEVETESEDNAFEIAQGTLIQAPENRDVKVVEVTAVED